MDLQTSIFNAETECPGLQDVVPLCDLAKGLEEAGEFELAENTLKPFWRGLLHRPVIEGLDQHAKA